MGLLNDLEEIKHYNMLIDLIKKEEIYDKKKNTLSGEEVFNLCYQRYKRIQEILEPLKNKLGEDIEITDISFANGMQDNLSIVVKYFDGNSHNYFVISNSDFNEFEISSSSDKVERYGLISSNRKIIANIFKQIYAESLESEFYINSTSKKFRIKDNCRIMSIRDINERVFSIDSEYVTYEKKGLIYNPENSNSSLKKVNELIKQKENIISIYNHLKVYEDDFPKVLLKKAN